MIMFAPIYFSYSALIDSYIHMYFPNSVYDDLFFWTKLEFGMTYYFLDGGSTFLHHYFPIKC